MFSVPNTLFPLKNRTRPTTRPTSAVSQPTGISVCGLYGLLKCIHEARALEEKEVAKLFKHPRLRSHLNNHLPALSRLFPVLKKLLPKN